MNQDHVISGWVAQLSVDAHRPDARVSPGGSAQALSTQRTEAAGRDG